MARINIEELYRGEGGGAKYGVGGIMGAFCLSSAACPFFCAQYSRSVTRFLLPFKRSIW